MFHASRSALGRAKTEHTSIGENVMPMPRMVQAMQAVNKYASAPNVETRCAARVPKMGQKNAVPIATSDADCADCASALCDAALHNVGACQIHIAETPSAHVATLRTENPVVSAPSGE